MNTADTIALAGAIGTGAGVLVGALIGIPSVYFARAAAKAGAASAESGKDSASASRESAEAARRSADEAAALNDLERDRRVQEREERHDDLGPKPPGKIVAEFRPNPRLGGGHGTLFGAITVPRGYRVRAEAREGNSFTLLGLDMLLHANRPYEFQIEPWPAGKTRAHTQEIWFRFWPPQETDDTTAWGCPCDRAAGEGADGAGHWEWHVQVVYDPPTPPAAASVPPPEPRRGGLFGR